MRVSERMKKQIKKIGIFLKKVEDLHIIIIKSVLQVSSGMLFIALMMFIVGLYDSGTGYLAFYISRNLAQFAIIIIAIGAVCSYFLKKNLGKVNFE